MRYLLIVCLLSSFIPQSFSQNRGAFSKGNHLISAGVGIGNIWKTFLEDVYTYPDNSYKVSSKGAFTLIYEYGLSKRISAGVALGYSKVVGNLNYFGLSYSETLTNFSVLARADFHIGKSQKFDPYFGGGLGYYSFNYYNDKPGLINSKVPGSFGYSAQIGAHYYFIPRLGAFAEVGYVGGSLAQIGLTYKHRR